MRYEKKAPEDAWGKKGLGKEYKEEKEKRGGRREERRGGGEEEEMREANE